MIRWSKKNAPRQILPTNPELLDQLIKIQVKKFWMVLETCSSRNPLAGDKNNKRSPKWAFFLEQFFMCVWWNNHQRCFSTLNGKTWENVLNFSWNFFRRKQPLKTLKNLIVNVKLKRSKEITVWPGTHYAITTVVKGIIKHRYGFVLPLCNQTVLTLWVQVAIVRLSNKWSLTLKRPPLHNLFNDRPERFQWKSCCDLHLCSFHSEYAFQKFPKFEWGSRDPVIPLTKNLSGQNRQTKSRNPFSFSSSEFFPCDDQKCYIFHDLLLFIYFIYLKPNYSGIQFSIVINHRLNNAYQLSQQALSRIFIKIFQKIVYSRLASRLFIWS